MVQEPIALLQLDHYTCAVFLGRKGEDCLPQAQRLKGRESAKVETPKSQSFYPLELHLKCAHLNDYHKPVCKSDVDRVPGMRKLRHKHRCAGDSATINAYGRANRSTNVKQ
jgi:hypothetical protein